MTLIPTCSQQFEIVGRFRGDRMQWERFLTESPCRDGFYGYRSCDCCEDTYKDVYLSLSNIYKVIKVTGHEIPTEIPSSYSPLSFICYYTTRRALMVTFVINVFSSVVITGLTILSVSIFALIPPFQWGYICLTYAFQTIEVS